MLKFLHTADWHLGMTRRFLTAEAEPRYRQDRIEAVRRLGEIAGAEGCAFVVAAGDLLDSNQVDPRTLARAADALRACPVPVYLLPGNHDAADAASLLCGPAFARLKPPNVHVLAEAGCVPVAPGVELVAAPWRTRRPLADLVAEACAGLESGPLRIVLGHGAVDTLSPDRHDPALVRVAEAESALSAGLIHYVALGDRHSPTSVGGSGRIRYAGTPEPTAFDEEAPGSVLLVSLDRSRAEVETRRVGRWTFARLAHAFAGDDDLDAFAAILDALPAKERTVLRLSLEGTLSLHGSARLEAIVEAARQVLAGLDVSAGRSELAVLPADGDFAGLELTGFAREALDDLRTRASALRAHPATARDALGLLIRLAGRAS
jgi:DNA repair exonuclease SbcCD nuclease subunit